MGIGDVGNLIRKTEFDPRNYGRKVNPMLKTLTDIL
jgi:hypothetical protein